MRNIAARWCPGPAALACVLLGSATVLAQPAPRDPHLAYAFPAGCQQGTSCQLVVGGQYLKEASEVYVSGEGVKAEIVRWYRPLTRGEFNQLRMRLDEMRMKLIAQGNRDPSEEEVAAAANISEQELKEMDIYRQRDRDPKRQPNEQLAEELTLVLTVAQDALPGKRELRLLTESALSNPLWLHVGQWPEIREQEPNDKLPDRSIDRLPIVVNGQILPGDCDTFAFTAQKGMRLVIVAAARDVIPYLADAVPGWFQAVVQLTDAAGNEVAYADSFQHRQDPALYFEVPQDGEYRLQIRDALYRGREDFVYRITLGEIPFVTGMFPLGARWDEKTTIQLEGWNLSQTTFETKALGFRQFRPVRWYSVPQENGQAVRVPVQMDLLREELDREPNNDIAAAQPVSPRKIINGRIDAPGDEDLFFISSGGRLAIDVQARRHGSPLDAMLTLVDAKGRELAFSDDFEDKTQALLTHHADPQLVATIPAAGAYLRLSDAQGNGGSSFVYRLVLRPPEPDFDLRLTPATLVARPGAVRPITVHVQRQDNFAEDIELALVDPPPGFALAGGIIPGNADRVTLTLSVPPTPTEQPVVLEMAGRAQRKGGRQPLVRPAIPAEDMMQAFIWHHLIPVEDWSVIVSGRPVPAFPVEWVQNLPPLPLPLGGDFLLPVRPKARSIAADDVHLEVKEPLGVTAEIPRRSR
jgi:hypothetical protein